MAANTNYQFMFANCAQAVGAGLRAAGLYDGFSWIPNERFQQISDYINTGERNFMWPK